MQKISSLWTQWLLSHATLEEVLSGIGMSVEDIQTMQGRWLEQP